MFVSRIRLKLLKTVKCESQRASSVACRDPHLLQWRAEEAENKLKNLNPKSKIQVLKLVQLKRSLSQPR